MLKSRFRLPEIADADSASASGGVAPAASSSPNAQAERADVEMKVIRKNPHKMRNWSRFAVVKELGLKQFTEGQVHAQCFWHNHLTV